MANVGTDNKSMIWGIAAGAGAVSFVIFMFLLGYAFWPALFLGLLIAVLVALLVWIGFYKPSEEEIVVQPASQTAPDMPKAAPQSEPEASVAPAAKASTPPDGFATGLMGDAGNRLKKETAAARAMPQGIAGPRNGQADDLKRIKGVGPKMETMLNGMGYYHFDQIAAWSAGEVSWVDDNLTGFKGRVSRDNWVEQAKLLAVGQETEFSKRVDDGEVY
jgi:predicted flap endonuclease-1-like 5' DNA nuclease